MGNALRGDLDTVARLQPGSQLGPCALRHRQRGQFRRVGGGEREHGGVAGPCQRNELVCGHGLGAELRLEDAVLQRRTSQSYGGLQPARTNRVGGDDLGGACCGVDGHALPLQRVGHAIDAVGVQGIADDGHGRRGMHDGRSVQRSSPCFEGIPLRFVALDDAVQQSGSIVFAVSCRRRGTAGHTGLPHANGVVGADEEALLHGLCVRRVLDVQTELDLAATCQRSQAHLALVSIQPQFRTQLVEIQRRQVKTARQQNGAVVGQFGRNVVDGGALVEQLVHGQADVQACLPGAGRVVEQAQAGRGSHCIRQCR
ncbi:MAG: hypothetical protein GAK34_03330 [Delftia tsuruhatensis]|nr:MAG: hypothetical protein GAK34_03330 [Delftia tsuruhatensis]